MRRIKKQRCGWDTVLVMLAVEDLCYVTQPGNYLVGTVDQCEIKRSFVVLEHVTARVLWNGFMGLYCPKYTSSNTNAVKSANRCVEVPVTGGTKHYTTWFALAKQAAITMPMWVTPRSGIKFFSTGFTRTMGLL